MNAVRRIERFLPLAAILVAAVLLLSGLSSLGLWDPWELDAADRARDLTSLDRVPLWFGAAIRAGFTLFGNHEWAGRLFGALSMLATVITAMALARRVSDARGGAYAGIVAAATPLVILHSQLMLGDGLSIGAQSVLGLGVVGFLAPFSAQEKRARVERGVWLCFALLAGFTAVRARGVLLGVLPPLVSALALVLAAPPKDRDGRIAAGIVGSTAVVLAAMTVRAIAQDSGTFSQWVGGLPSGTNPPTFDGAVETVFHTLAPFSPLIVIAAARTIGDESEHGPIKRMYVLWAAFAWAAYVVFSSRYGLPTFLAVAPLAALGGAALRSMEDETEPDRVSAIVVVLLTGLLIRDFALYPSSMLASFPVDSLGVPGGYDPRKQWAVAFLLVNAPLALSLCVPNGSGTVTLRFREVLSTAIARRGLHVFWVVLGAAVAAGCEVFAGLALVSGERLNMSSLLIRAAPLIALLPFLAALAYVVAEVIVAKWRLGRFRMAPAVLGGVLFGAWVAFGFSRGISEQFSPRELYRTYTELRASGDVLLDYHTGGRASKYYAPQPIVVVADQQELIRKLTEDGRRWALFPRTDLQQVDREFRRITNRHLFVADGSNDRFILVTNKAVENREDESPLSTAVRTEAPRFRHPVGAVFGSSIELLGYDINLPNGDSVGPGQSFYVTWYWKARARTPGSYTIFLHVDGEGNRLNGDHVPVDGLVPVTSWDQGDVIVDRQELTVPASYRPGTYTFFIGFFAGENRLPVTAGPKDDANRAIAGTLIVR